MRQSGSLSSSPDPVASVFRVMPLLGLHRTSQTTINAWLIAAAGGSKCSKSAGHKLYNEMKNVCQRGVCFFFFIGSEPGGRIGSDRFDSIRFGLVWFGLVWSVSVSVSAVPLVTSLGRLAVWVLRLVNFPPPASDYDYEFASNSRSDSDAWHAMRQRHEGGHFGSWSWARIIN